MSGRRLVVDWIKCDAHGICAELLPEWIRLDDWGYPMLDPTPITPDLAKRADQAVKLCPKLALRLTPVESPVIIRR